MTTKPEELAFHEICSHLNDLQDRILEIEILSSASCPPGPPRILRDDNCVGVPKTLLIPAFKHALNILALGRPHVRVSVDEKERHEKERHENEHLRLKATVVVLLLAPEHLTAANIRKRYLQQLAVSPSVPDSGMSMSPPSSPSHQPPTPISPHPRSPATTALTHALNTELNLLDSLLTSPLHRHAKSPTLWSHRRWVLTTFPKIPAILNGRGTLAGEYDIVHRAASRHARNYVAFDYLRRRMGFAARDGDGAEQVELAMPMEMLVKHALANPGDVSRLAFLQHVLSLHSLKSTDQSSDHAAGLTVEHVLDTAVRLHLRGEAIWTFLRLALVSPGRAGVGEQERLKMLGALREWRDGTDGGSGGEEDADVDRSVDAHARDLTELRAVVDRSLRWIARWEIVDVV